MMTMPDTPTSIDNKEAVAAAPIEQASRHWLWAAVAALAFAGALTTATAATSILYLQPWLGMDHLFSIWLRENRCFIPLLCQEPVIIDQPLGVAFIVATVLLALIGVALVRSPSVNTADTPATPWGTISLLICGAVALLTLALQLYQLFIQKRPPGNWIWAVGVGTVLVGATLWDRWQERSTLLRTFATLLAGAGIVVSVVGAAAMLTGYLSVWSAGLLLLCGLGLLGAGSVGSVRYGSSFEPVDYIAILLLSLLMLLLAMLRAWSWRYSFVGDEWAFYEMGLATIHDPNPWEWFAIRGYNGYFAGFSSQLIGWAMALFGESVYGWRLSSVLPAVLSTPAVYVLGSWLFGRSAGFLAAVFLVAGHTLLQFAMTPYNNTQALPIITMSLALVVWALRSPSALRFALVGVALGFGFLVYAAARLAIIPIAVLLFFHAWGNLRVFLLSTFFVGTGALFTAAPMIFNLENWLSLLRATPLQSEENAVRLGVVTQVGRNMIAGLLSFAYNPANTHYVIGPLFDPLSGLFLLLGVAVLFIGMWKNRRMMSWVVASLLFILLIGGVQQYARISITRVFLLPPFFSVYAGVGAAWLFGVLLRRRENWILPASVVLLCAVVILNQYHIQAVALGKIPLSPQSLLLRQMMEVADADGSGAPVYVVWATADPQMLARMMRAHNIPPGKLSILTPAELMDMERLCQDDESPAILLIRSGEPGYQEIRDHIRECWSTGQSDEMLDQAGFPMFNRIVKGALDNGAKPVSDFRGVESSQPHSYRLPKISRFVVDGAGVLYGLSREQNRVYRLELATQEITSFGLHVDAPRDLAITQDGLLLASAANPQLIWYDATGALVRALPATSDFGVLQSLVVAENGDIFGADPLNSQIVQLSPAGELLESFTGQGMLGRPAGFALTPQENMLWSLDAEGGALNLLLLGSDSISVTAPAPASTLEMAGSVLATADGGVIIAAPQEQRVYHLSASGKLRDVWTQLLPMGMNVDSEGCLLVSGPGLDEIVIYPSIEGVSASHRPVVRIAQAAELADSSAVVSSASDSPLPVSPLAEPADGDFVERTRYTYLDADTVDALARPAAIAADASGKIVAADGQARRLTIFAGTTGEVVEVNDDLEVQFREISDISIDASGRIYILDAGRSVIDVFDRNGAHLDSYGVAANIFGTPRGLHVDSQGRIWVAATSLGELVILGQDGVISDRISIGSDTPGQPVDVLVTDSGEIWVADGGRGELTVHDPDGNVIRRMQTHKFNTVEGAHFAYSHGNIFITQPEQGRILMFDETGRLLRQWDLEHLDERPLKLTSIAVTDDGAIWALDKISSGVIYFPIE